MRCDILLLTEVSERVELSGFALHATSTSMAPRRRWAAVGSRRKLRALTDPHGASALAEVDGLRVCSSILPWRTCGTQEQWRVRPPHGRPSPPWLASRRRSPRCGAGTGTTPCPGASERFQTGPEIHPGRRWPSGFAVAYTQQPHQIHGLLSIDHDAIPESWGGARDAEHFAAYSDGAKISDHDSYVIDIPSTP